MSRIPEGYRRGGSPGYRENAVWSSSPPTPSRHRPGSTTCTEFRNHEPHSSRRCRSPSALRPAPATARRLSNRRSNRSTLRSTVTTAVTTPPDTAPPETTIADTEPPSPETSTTSTSRGARRPSAGVIRQAAGLAAIAPPTSPDDVARFVAGLHRATRHLVRRTRCPNGRWNSPSRRPTSTGLARRKTIGSTWQRSNSRRATSVKSTIGTSQTMRGVRPVITTRSAER